MILRRASVASVAAVACLAVLSACASSGAGTSGSSGASAGSGSIPVGGLNLLTGQFASFGQGTLQGEKAAVNEVNGAGGVLGKKLNLVVADSTSDPVDGIPAATKLVNLNHVTYEVGVAGPLADATVQLFTRAGIAVLTPGGDVNFDHNTDPLIWRLTPSDNQLGVAMALYARQKGYQKAALMFTNGSTAVGLGDVVTKTFTALGGQVVSDVTIQPDLNSYQAEVSRILAAKPDVILVEMDAPTAGVVFREMQGQNNLSVPLIGTDEDVGSDFLKAVGATTASKYLISLEGGTYNSPAAGVFASAVKDVSSQQPLANAEYTYDGIIMASLAMTAAKSTDSSALTKGIPLVTAKGGTPVYSYSQGLQALKAGKRITYIGASGPLYYNQYHNVFGPFIAVRANPDGSYTTVETLTPEQLAKATR